MRIHEITTIKPVKPLTPGQTRIRSLKQNVDQARKAVKGEQDAQRRQRDIEKQRKAQGSKLG
jgi:hypothetical protein